MNNILRNTNYKDKDNNIITEGDYLLTDEGNWKAVVVWNDRINDFYLEDSKGGFSAYPNWNNCKILDHYNEKYGVEL